MIEDVKNSAADVLKKRFADPFYGSLIISWLIWNWQIPYITFFVSQDKISGTKANYLIDNYNSCTYNLVLPLLSASFLTMAMPFILGYIEDIIDFAKVTREKRSYKKQSKVILTNGEYLKYKYRILIDATIKSVETSWNFSYKTVTANTQSQHLKNVSETINNQYVNFFLYKEIMLYNLETYTINSPTTTFVYIMKNLGYINNNGAISDLGVLKIEDYKKEVSDKYSEYIKLYYSNKLDDVLTQ